jgi:microcystin-dependent protein
MSSPFVAEIRVVGFNFPPTGWAQCNGQLMPLSQNTALFSLLGTVYGGDGKATFALPNIQGAAVVGAGQGPGLTEYWPGTEGGSTTVTLQDVEMPAHNHTVQASPDPAEVTAPGPNRVIARSKPGNAYVAGAGNPPVTQIASQALPPAGGGLPHNNMQPALVLNFVIALQGVFPPRS